MAVLDTKTRLDSPGPDRRAVKVGPIGRLGHYTAAHLRAVLIAWLVIAVVLGFFAPRVETALSGAGWETTGSQSVQARQSIDKNFKGLSSYGLMTVLYSPTQTVSTPDFQAAVAKVERTLRADGAVRTVIAPAAGVSVSRDGHTAIVQAGAARDSNAMVVAADRLKGKLSALSTSGVQVHLTGASAMWSDFNAANRSAMLKSEVISWPVTLLILLVAFGSLVAAGLPLMLTMVGLMAAAGSLYLTTKIIPVSIWAMNFALMFALALGIDYALFIVRRFRGAFFGSKLTAEEATAVTMDTAGKAVLFSGVTVLISLSAVMLVPSPAFRSMSLGIMLAVLFVLAATLTLLPAVLAKLGPRVDKLSLPWAHSGEHRSARFAAWGQRLWRRPLAYGAVALAILVALAIPVTQLKTAMPSIKVVPTTDSSRIGYQQVQTAMGPGSTGPLQIVAPASAATQAAQIARQAPGVVAVMPAQTSNGHALITAIPKQDPSNPAVGQTIDRLRAALPPGSLIGGGRREPRPPERAVGQDAAGDLGPVFFFAMIFAISMDYTVFLLSSAKEHWDRTHDPEEAMVGGLAHSGRVIFAAGAVMVAVFLTFALSGPLPPKEMGIILGVAVLLDAALVRLLLLPVLLRLMGKWAWYLPRWARRVLPEVSFGHA